MGRIEHARDVDAAVEAIGMFPEDFGRVNGERGIEKDRRDRDFAALNQVDEIDDQLLGTFDREGRNEEGTFCRGGIGDFRCESPTALFRGGAVANPIAIGRFLKSHSRRPPAPSDRVRGVWRRGDIA